MKNRHFAIFTSLLCALLLMAGLLAVWAHKAISLAEPHPEDFSPHITPAEMEALGGDPEIKKIWYLSHENWFLSPDLTDLSQAITTQPLYCIPEDRGYTICSIGENGEPTQGITATAPQSSSVPYGLYGLTYAIIENDLSEVDYQDYIITYAPRLYTVIVWARCAGEDRFLTYPVRPEFVGTGVGTVYTLSELKAVFTAAYESNGSR